MVFQDGIPNSWIFRDPIVPHFIFVLYQIEEGADNYHYKLLTPDNTKVISRCPYCRDRSCLPVIVCEDQI